jgi:hypothetical protein
VTEPRYVVVDPDHRRACSICGSVVAAGETDHHNRFHAETDRLWAAIEILRRAVPRVQTRLDALEGNRPTVMVPADAYERLRMLAVQLDGELRHVRQLLVADPSKVALKRELLTIAARADYWYDTWKDARGEQDAPEWRGPAGDDGVWMMQT